MLTLLFEIVVFSYLLEKHENYINIPLLLVGATPATICYQFGDEIHYVSDVRYAMSCK